MSNTITLSIVTPSYNQGRFLAETIESVLNQEGVFSIDYIIVDGGSSDNSIEIIKQYDALLKNNDWQVKCSGITFRWLSEKDNGQADALMKGFNMANGEIFAWLNSDDIYLPGALQTAADFFRTQPVAGLMYGEANYIDIEGATISRYHTEEFDLIQLASANIICQPTAFFSRNSFNAVGGLDVSLDFVMDYDFWIKIGKRFSCRYVPQLLATYRLHETSKTISNDTLYRNCEESLAVTIRHFGWAPLTRIYTSCRVLCKARLPQQFSQNRLSLVLSALFCTLCRSLYLNRGIHRNDLTLLRVDNFRKLFKSRMEIMTGKPEQDGQN